MAEDRIERLLALLLTQPMKSERDRMVSLSVAGFSNIEIADLLQTSAANVASRLYEARQKRKAPKNSKTKRRG